MWVFDLLWNGSRAGTKVPAFSLAWCRLKSHFSCEVECATCPSPHRCDRRQGCLPCLRCHFGFVATPRIYPQLGIYPHVAPRVTRLDQIFRTVRPSRSTPRVSRLRPHASVALSRIVRRLSGLERTLQPHQIFVELALGVCPEHLPYRVSQQTSGRVVGHLDMNSRAAANWFQFDHAGVLDWAAFDGPPRDVSIRLESRRNRIPFHSSPGGPSHRPA